MLINGFMPDDTILVHSVQPGHLPKPGRPDDLQRCVNNGDSANQLPPILTLPMSFLPLLAACNAGTASAVFAANSSSFCACTPRPSFLVAPCTSLTPRPGLVCVTDCLPGTYQDQTGQTSCNSTSGGPIAGAAHAFMDLD